MEENKETVLVTGGTGFVAMQIILQLLQRGYKVKTTVRNLSSKDKIIETLKNNGISSFENLSFVTIELTKDDNWEEAMKNCKYVLSVASPVFFEIPKDENEAIRPAVEGILRVLKFAKKSNVKRVIMTSNFGSVGFSQFNTNKMTTEEDWTNPLERGLSVYEKSKTMAEKAAWEFIKKEGGNLEFATINAVAILGKSLDTHISGSFNILTHLLDGSIKAVPNIWFNIVDVRDVADLHIRAMENENADGNRFIATADGKISMPEIAVLLKEKYPELTHKISDKKIPNFVLNLASHFNRQAKEAALLLKVNRNVSNEKAKKILGWKPVSSQEQAIIAAIESLLRFGIIK